MLELLAPDGVTDDLLELVVARSLAHRRSQVGLIQREKTRPQPSVSGEPDPVAIPAERLRDRVDEPDPALAIGESVGAGGGAGLPCLRLQRVDGVDGRP